MNEQLTRRIAVGIDGSPDAARALAWAIDEAKRRDMTMVLVHGALFPRERLARPDFETLAANYYKRWDITTEEDIVASERQQKGLESPYASAGRFSHREPLVHAIDNWILDRVLD
jgi:nucleotide-binding universal stress UspA family protein